MRSGGGELSGRKSLTARESSAAVRSRRAALWAVRFVLCFLLICTVVAPVPFVCCSVKLPLSRPTSFCLFLSILFRTPAGGGVAAWCFCCRPQPIHNSITNATVFFLRCVLSSAFSISYSSVMLAMPQWQLQQQSHCSPCRSSPWPDAKAVTPAGET